MPNTTATKQAQKLSRQITKDFTKLLKAFVKNSSSWNHSISSVVERMEKMQAKRKVKSAQL